MDQIITACQSHPTNITYEWLRNQVDLPYTELREGVRQLCQDGVLTAHHALMEPVTRNARMYALDTPQAYARVLVRNPWTAEKWPDGFDSSRHFYPTFTYTGI